MNVHFVAGFLGAGKTTAIVSACSRLMDDGVKVGVVTNEIGKFQVDRRFMESNSIPSAEVSGSCLCGRFEDFRERLAALAEKERPQEIFVELIGSSVGLVNDIRRGLSDFMEAGKGRTTLTVLADSRLMAVRLSNRPLPFSDEVVYLFERQLSEADILVLNKIDLIEPIRLDKLARGAEARYPGPEVLPLSLRDDESADAWIEALLRPKAGPGSARFKPPFDRALYEQAEASLAWLETEFRISVADPSAPTSASAIRQSLFVFFDALWKALAARGAVPGHVKALIRPYSSGAWVKVGFSSGDLTASSSSRAGACPLSISDFDSIDAPEARLMLNARALAGPDVLSSCVDEAIAAISSGAAIRVEEGKRLAKAPIAGNESAPSRLKAPSLAARGASTGDNIYA